ncbi:hypothetical protein GCM10017744_014280 [Streptomyces antimycoticus]
MARVAPPVLARVKGPVAVPAGSTAAFPFAGPQRASAVPDLSAPDLSAPALVRYALGERMARLGLDSRRGKAESAVAVVTRTRRSPTASAVSLTPVSAAGAGSAWVAWVRAPATAAGVTSVPSWNRASRRVNTQPPPLSRVQDSARAGTAPPLPSSRVSPSVTPSRLSKVASAPYGEKRSAGGKAIATRRRPPPAPAPASYGEPSRAAKQPVSSGTSSSAAAHRWRTECMGVVLQGRRGVRRTQR